MERVLPSRAEILTALALGELSAAAAVKMLKLLPPEGRSRIRFRNTRPFPTEEGNVEETDGDA